MCKECGCGLPGENPVGITAHPVHEKADHTHGHDNPGQHQHGGEHEHEHVHEHEHGPGHHHGESHQHRHSHPHAHSHAHSAHDNDAIHDGAEQSGRRRIQLREAILGKNDRFAERNRGFFHARGLLVLNVLSSPGSGKTTFLRETVRSLKSRLRVGIVVGDLATDNDARQLRQSGVPVVQITTGTMCHLEAEMVARSLKQLELQGLELLMIENVGNLVCPAAYDLGEDVRIVLTSVTEGEDKPLKYPPIFQAADVVIISKIDLGPACEFDRSALLANLRRAAPKAQVFEVSAKTGKGMEEWIRYLMEQQDLAKKRDPLPV